MKTLFDIVGYGIDFGKFFLLPLAIYLLKISIDEFYQIITIRTRLDDGDDE